MKTVNLLIAVFLLAMTTMVQAAVVASGKVGYMSGTLVAQRADGTVKVLGPKSEIMAGDMLITAKDSYAQIQMNDGSRMTLRPNSNLRIEAFQFNKDEPDSDNAVFRLLKGGFRTVTGLIGKRGNVDAYKLHAAASTIGIRGTDYTSRLCATPNCQDDLVTSDKTMDEPQAQQLVARDATPQSADLPTSSIRVLSLDAGQVTPPPTTPPETPPGLYVTVHDGQVILAQAVGLLYLGRGETGFSSATELVKLPAPPAFMIRDIQQINQQGGNPNSSNPSLNKSGCAVQ